MCSVRPTAQASWAGIGKERIEGEGKTHDTMRFPSWLSTSVVPYRYQCSYENSSSKGPSRA